MVPPLAILSFNLKGDKPDDPNDQPEALAVIVVNYDGVRPARLVTDPPAPTPVQAGSYDSFIRRICGLYAKRFTGT